MNTSASADSRRASSASGAVSRSAYPIVVHCHLRWDWVWQRPQQFLSRLSKRHRVLFVEGPSVSDQISSPTYQLKTLVDYPNITILQTTMPASRWSDGEYIDEQRRIVVQKAINGALGGKFDNAVQWFYDPMAVTSFTGKMNEIATVYDCMDELSQFKGAPPQLIERERDLLQAADVVFAGGRKMQQSKSRYHANCHFYGCGVDIAHFGQARSANTSVPSDVAHLAGKPMLGYFGVVDERMDLQLLAKLADAASWNIVMVGPVCKIDEKTLPQRANLHWMGGREYSMLPAYTKAFDVCLMPFALNEATEYINPTKALEYMATAKPIVSSAVPDVVSNFAEVVQIADSHDEFVQMCREEVAQPNAKRIAKGLEMAQRNTWDAIVFQLEKHIAEALQTRSSQTSAQAIDSKEELDDAELAVSA